MDHFSRPKNPVHPPPVVSCYSLDEYDGGPVLSYLSRRGWTPEELTECYESQRSRTEIHAILQTWCFFGILTEILGVRMSRTDFTKKYDNGQMGITTEYLPRLVKEWIERESVLAHDVRRKDEAHMSKCLSGMSILFTRLTLKHPDFLDKLFYLSLKCMYEYLLAARALAYGVWDPMRGEWPVSFDFFMPQGEDFALERMKQDGWCTSETTMLSLCLSAQEMYFISSMNRPGPEKSHVECSETKCVAYHIDQHQYRTKHLQERCSCDFVYASQRQLSRILLAESGSFPLIQPFEVNDADSARPQVNVIDSNGPHGDVEFVAISHVWSDGLGNVADNAIPACQFRRLSKLVRSLYNGTPHPFWLDTLCFPLEPQEAYNMALVCMRESYEKAHKVLVLDSYLLAQDLESMSADEVVARIISSPWNRRLWTLQEGSLARTLVFQFADTFIDMSEVIQRSFEQRADLESLIFPNIWNSFSELRALELRDDKIMNVLAAKRACAFRSTSVALDEPLCLGNLLGIDPAEVVNADPNERMEIIWDSQKEYFASVIFWLGPKLTKNGYRWAAASFMDGSITNNKTYHGQTPEAYLSDSGLMVQLPGILLSTLEIVLDSAFVFYDEAGTWFRVICITDMAGEHVGGGTVVDPWIETTSHPERLALLTLAPLKEEDTLGSELAFYSKLASVQEIDEDFIRVRLLYSVHIIKMESRDVAELQQSLGMGPGIAETIIAQQNIRHGGADSNVMNENQGCFQCATKCIAEETSFESSQNTEVDTSFKRWVLKGRRTASEQIWCVD